MQHEESSYPKDWLRLAEKDLKRAENLLDEGDTELGGFCLQQAIEKFLKAFLLLKGWKLRRIHNLDTLLDDSVAFDHTLEDYRKACQTISAFYTVERYPFIVEHGITQEDVRTSLKQVGGLVAKLRKEISA